MTQRAIVYGAPPHGLVDIPENAIQVSPLMPQSDALEDITPSSIDDAVILAPPGTLERAYVLALTLRALKPGSSLAALAPNDKGGTRIAKELVGFGCQVETSSRAHHRICRATRPDSVTGIDMAIAEGGLQVHAQTGLWTQPGIFSWNRIDPGSALLAEMLPRMSGKGSDLGCGTGYLGLKILTSPQVKALWLVDTDRRAIAAARRNIPDPRATFVWGDARTAELGIGLDFVVMNPPFHDRGEEDRHLGRTFIERAASLLRRNGTCWLVANRHLPYEDVLAARFSSQDLRADRAGFKIYEAVK